MSGSRDHGRYDTSFKRPPGPERAASSYPSSRRLSISWTSRVAVVLTNRSAPPATVTPVLVYPDVRAAVAWLQAAFGFEERVRIGAAHRAQMVVGGDGWVVVADVHGQQVPPTAGRVTHVIKVRVPDADAAFARAQEAGARVVETLTTFEYGERSCMVEDPAGHRWELSQTLRDVAPEEWGGLAFSPA
jgi:uncharacterized glyoxalase superfamily protein PhnB